MVDYVDLTSSVTEQGGTGLFDKSSPVSTNRSNRTVIPIDDDVIVIDGGDTSLRSAALSVKRVRRPPLPGEDIVAINGKDAEADRHKATVRSPSTAVYNQRGLLVVDGRDVCDCLVKDCVGCHYPCSRCQSLKCGSTCRINRSWMYKDVHVEAGSKRQTMSYPTSPAPGTHKL